MAKQNYRRYFIQNLNEIGQVICELLLQDRYVFRTTL
jgi:hypothetical protein